MLKILDRRVPLGIRGSMRLVRYTHGVILESHIGVGYPSIGGRSPRATIRSAWWATALTASSSLPRRAPPPVAYLLVGNDQRHGPWDEAGLTVRPVPVWVNERTRSRGRGWRRSQAITSTAVTI